MSAGPNSASAASALIDGYCDEYLTLSNLFAETLAQVESNPGGLSACTESLERLSRIQEGMASLSGVIEALRRREAQLAASQQIEPMQDDEPPPAVPPRASEQSGQVAPQVQPPSPDPEPSQSQPCDVPPSAGQESASSPLSFEFLPDMSDEPVWETGDTASAPEEKAQDADARVANAYSFLSEEPKPEPVSEVADRIDAQPAPDPSAPVQFGRPCKPGLMRALSSPSAPAPLRVQPTPCPGSIAEVVADSIAQTNESQLNGPRQTSLKGANSTMPVRAVFQFLEQVRKTGVLDITLADEVITFEFEGGWIHSCRTSNPNKADRLGDLLADICEPKQVQALLANAASMNNPQIGELLVRSGLVSNGQVLAALETQVHMRFRRACESADATYTFADASVTPSDGRLHIAPMELTFVSRRNGG